MKHRIIRLLRHAALTAIAVAVAPCLAASPQRPTVSDYSLDVLVQGRNPQSFNDFQPSSSEVGKFTTSGKTQVLALKKDFTLQRNPHLWAYEVDETGVPTQVVYLRLRTLSDIGTTAADFNHDGRIEILVAARDSLELVTYAEGTAVSTYLQNLPGPLRIDAVPITADFDGDGHTDAAFHMSQSNFSGGISSQLIVFRGNGANDFAEELKLATGGEGAGDRQIARSLVSGDFNHDGRADIAILFEEFNSPEGFSYPVKVFLNDGAASFRSPYTVADGRGFHLLRAGDINDDGRDDLVATSTYDQYEGGLLHMFVQDSAGRLVEAGAIEVDASSIALEIVDVDRDGRMDVVAGSELRKRVSYYLQQRNGAFSERRSTIVHNSSGSAPLGPSTVTAADIDDDGCSDLWITAGVGDWLLKGNGCVRTLYTPGDMNDDGKTDLLWRHAAQKDLALWRMEGPARMQGFGYGVDSVWKVLATGDFNGDRWMDLLWSDGQNMQLWEGDGLSHFAGSWLPKFPQGWRLAATGDFDGDGNDDLFWRNAADTDAALWRLVGAQVIEQRGYATSPTWRIEGSGDFNADGRTDLVWTNGVQRQLWQAQPGLMFAGVELPGLPSSWQLAGVSDVSGDGKADLLWFQPQIGELAIWEYRGPGEVRGRGYAVGPDWRILQTGDFNADGFGDLVWTNGRQMQMWQSQGEGFLGLPMDDYPAGWLPVEHSKAIKY